MIINMNINKNNNMNINIINNNIISYVHVRR